MKQAVGRTFFVRGLSCGGWMDEGCSLSMGRIDLSYICHIAGWLLLYLLLTIQTIVQQIKVWQWNKRKRLGGSIDKISRR